MFLSITILTTLQILNKYWTDEWMVGQMDG